ncbi:MAG: T9SS type A sorting domain-containing protein, partial [Bacteroidota bacterium]
ALIDNRYTDPSPFIFNLSHTFSANYDSIYVHAEVTSSQAFSQASNLRIAVIERDIYFCSPPGTNGESHFEGVMKKMLPNATGTVLPATWTNGQMVSYDFSWKLTNVYDKNTLAVVGFVQSDATKEVHQTAYSTQQQLVNDAKLTCNAVTGIPAVLCGTTVTPVVEFENLGSASLTALTINYQLDGGPITPISWSGSLATGATGTVNIPTLNVTAGAHSFVATCVDPNSGTDVNTLYDSFTITFNVSSNIGLPLPLVQDFVTVTFPPVGWTKINADNGPTWTRVTTGLPTNSGSAKIDFYNSPSTQIDELWTASYDFSQSGIGTVQLDFDVAYRQYSAAYSDRIEVNVSTDCGQTWATIFNKAGSALSTLAGYQTSAFTPTATQWRHESASMTQFVGSPSVFVRFKATSAYGNNGYVDNINVSVITSIKENNLSRHVNVYPIPSTGIVNLDVNFETGQNLKVAVYNLIGEVITQFEIAKTVGGLFPIDLSKVADGAYTVKISTDAETTVKQINIVK